MKIWCRIVLSLLLSVGIGYGIEDSFMVWASDKPVDQICLGEPERVWWESEMVGKWSSVKNAYEYQVKLFCADNVMRDEENWREFDPEDEDLETIATIRTSDKSYDFREYLEDGHTYFFAVRATPKINEQAYVEAGEWIASPDADYRNLAVMGLTGGTWRNYLEGSRYEDEDGNLLGGGWHLIQGSWYLFDEDGYRLTGWQENGGNRYYMDEEGRMQTGWILYDEAWYYANEDGQMQTGWIMTQPGEYYYLDEAARIRH